MPTTKKYDRQIRLFGKSVQKKIHNLSVNISSYEPDTLISGEILKNIVLLGVNRLYADKNTIASYSRLVPNKVEEINPRVQLSESMFNDADLTYLISNCTNSQEEFMENTVFICTKHLTFRNIKEECSDTTFKQQDGVRQCLLGAIIVQELVKKVSDEKYSTNYSLTL